MELSRMMTGLPFYDTQTQHSNISVSATGRALTTFSLVDSS